jgi:hypothetical protein
LCRCCRGRRITFVRMVGQMITLWLGK